MKLLLDENLSRRIVPSLQQRFPGSTQVALVGLERAADVTLWDYAHAAVLEALLNAAERVIATLQLDDVGIVEIF